MNRMLFNGKMMITNKFDVARGMLKNGLMKKRVQFTLYPLEKRKVPWTSDPIALSHGAGNRT